jgi:hypothetical protein
LAEDGAAPPEALRSLAGRATNVLTGAGAAGVAIQITGVADLAADANGNFALQSEAPGGRYRVTVSGATVVERQTSVTFPGGTALLSLIPTSFDLRAFDEMVRHFGEAGVLKDGRMRRRSSSRRHCSTRKPASMAPVFRGTRLSRRPSSRARRSSTRSSAS